jgi:glycosyltransferase involved in cell wall biosynthesis
VIRQLLKSLSMQTYPIENFEIIIVDDSTDDTFDKILKFSAGLKNVKAIHRGTREGWKGGSTQ